MCITSRSPRVINLGANLTPAHVGPGTYEVIQGIRPPNESPYPFNTTAARKWGEPADNPGPADYNPMVPRLNISGAVATMQSMTPRYSFQISQNPSPADHSQIKDWAASVKRKSKREPMSSRTTRDSFIPIESSVSPADYNIRPRMDKGSHFGRAVATARVQHTPGPADYFKNPQAKKPTLPTSAFMSGSAREIFPPPDVNVESIGLSHSKRRIYKSARPFGKGSKRKPIWNKTNTPAPGTYDVQSKGEVRKSKAPFGTRTGRSSTPPNGNPGPADYQKTTRSPIKSRPNIPFSQRSPRFQEERRDYNISPGQYDIDTKDVIKQERSFETESPAFMYAGERNAFPVNSAAPGPGIYSPEEGERRSSYHRLKTKISSSPRDGRGTCFNSSKQIGPGPGAYSTTPETKSRGGYITRDKRRGVFGSGTETPGPGSYDLSSSMIKPTYNVTYSIA